jgi:hypothetical protein
VGPVVVLPPANTLSPTAQQMLPCEGPTSVMSLSVKKE